MFDLWLGTRVLSFRVYFFISYNKIIFWHFSEPTKSLGVWVDLEKSYSIQNPNNLVMLINFKIKILNCLSELQESATFKVNLI